MGTGVSIVVGILGSLSATVIVLDIILWWNLRIEVDYWRERTRGAERQCDQLWREVRALREGGAR